MQMSFDEMVTVRGPGRACFHTKRRISTGSQEKRVSMPAK